MSAQSTTQHFWLPDDTEEDLVGSYWHQRAIDRLYTSLIDLAGLLGTPWHVGNQLTLVAWTPGGTSWRPSPDIMVHPTAGPDPRKEMSARDDGPPALVIEVASETTWRYDVDSAQGKAAGYLALGVPDYLVFDPTGDFLGVPCRGWQRSGDTLRDWQPTTAGRYLSSALGIGFQPEGTFLRVFDPAESPVAWPEEIRRENRALAQRIAELEAELHRLRGQRVPATDTGS